MISLIESLPTRKLLNQGFLVVKLKSSPRKIHGLVEYYYVPFIVNTIHPDLLYSLFITRCVSVTRSVLSAKHTTAYPVVTPEFTSVFWLCLCCSIFSFLCSIVLTIVCLLGFEMSVFLRITASDYSFGIFKLFSIKKIHTWCTKNRVYLLYYYKTSMFIKHVICLCYVLFWEHFDVRQGYFN